MRLIVTHALFFFNTHAQMLALLLPWMTIHRGSLAASQETIYDIGRMLRDTHTVWVGIDAAGITDVAQLEGLNIDLAALGFSGVQDIDGLKAAVLTEPPVQSLEATLACLIIAAVLSVVAFGTQIFRVRGHHMLLPVAIGASALQITVDLIALGVFMGAIANYADSDDIFVNAAGLGALLLSIFLTVLALALEYVEFRSQQQKLNGKASRGETAQLIPQPRTYAY